MLLILLVLGVSYVTCSAILFASQSSPSASVQSLYGHPAMCAVQCVCHCCACPTHTPPLLGCARRPFVCDTAFVPGTTVPELSYRKIPIIPWVCVCSRGRFAGLIFGGPYYWKEFCVSKWVGLDNKNSLKLLKQLK